MASPFSIFRKHQRAMIAVLGILCMFAFTFTGFMGGFGSGSGGGGGIQNTVVVTTSFGDFGEADLRNMRYQRNEVKMFLGQALLLTVDPQMRPFLQQRLSEMLETQIIGPSTEAAVLETRVLAREAKEAGVVVSDDSVTDFLREQTGDQVRNEDFQNILNNLSKRGDRPMSKAMLYEALRTELLAKNMQQMFFSSLQATPGERWGFYQRLKRRVRVELAPVAIEDFVSKIADPADGVAHKFFDQYKDQEPQPGSPEPGFKIPHRAAFQYFEAHFEDFYHPEAISEAEIAQHYEKFKDTQYLYNEAFGVAEEDEEPEAETPGPEKKAPESKPDGKQPAESKPEASKPEDKKPEDKKPEDKKPEDKKPEDKKPEDKKPEDKKPEDKKPEDKKPAEPAADSKDERDNSGSSCGSDNQADEEDKQADDKEKAPASAAADKKSAPADQAGKTPAAGQSAVPPAAAATPGLSPPQNVPVAGSSNTGAAPPPAIPASPPTGTAPPPAGTGIQLATKKSTVPPLSDRYVLPRDITKGPNPKYEPLWQAEPKIRKALAGTKAVQEMDKALLGLKSKLRPFSDAQMKWESRKEQDPDAQRPKPPDIQALAKSVRGVTPGKIPLSPDYQIAQVPGIGGSQVSGQPFVAFAATGLKLYQAVESQDNDGNRYLFWKTDDQDARVPQFSEVRDEVVQVWKLHEARRPMMHKAEELAKQARASHKSLKDALAGQPGIKVTETPAFSWMTGGSAGQFNQRSQPRLSEVPGTVDIGDEFMRSVFDLQVGDVGVAENHPQTAAYVVRVTSSEPPQAVLRDMFLADRFESYAPVVMEANGQLYRKWLHDQMAAAKVHWVRPPYDEARSSE
jgi:hypothetical protein